MDDKPPFSIAAAVAVVAAVVALMLAAALLKGDRTAQGSCIGAAGLIIGAFYFRLAIQWLNRRHDPRRAKRPPDAP